MKGLVIHRTIQLMTKLLVILRTVNKLVIDSISDHDSWTEIKRSPVNQKIKPASGMQKTRSDKDLRERCIIMNAVEPQA